MKKSFFSVVFIALLLVSCEETKYVKGVIITGYPGVNKMQILIDTTGDRIPDITATFKRGTKAQIGDTVLLELDRFSGNTIIPILEKKE